MPKGKQKSKRARKRVEVHYGVGDTRYVGFSGNVSRTGVMVRAAHVFPPGTVLDIELKFPANIFRVRGEVVWAREGSYQWVLTGRVGMGITFIEPPEDLLRLLETMSP